MSDFAEIIEFLNREHELSRLALETSKFLPSTILSNTTGPAAWQPTLFDGAVNPAESTLNP